VNEGTGPYEAYGSGYSEFGGNMPDYGGGEFVGGYGAPYGSGSGYDGTSGYYGGPGSSSSVVSGTQVYVRNVRILGGHTIVLRELWKGGRIDDGNIA
jgi:hypothetical protein